MQAAAATRVAADLFTAAYSPLLAAAALIWLGCFAAWSWRYLPYYWRPRSDGKPG
ncbi:MAG TPA: NnrS family protein [Usitatibacter sp.]|nr:NnrS family protein [Usitatibacter sp.]